MSTTTETSFEPTPVRSGGGRLSVRINDDTADAMARLVVRDRNATEVVRRALALLDLVEQESRDGKHLELVSRDGKTRQELRLLY